MEQPTKRARPAERPQRRAIDTARHLHAPVLAVLKAAEEARSQAARSAMPTQFDLIVSKGQSGGERRGDRILAAMRDTFHNGLGIEWGEHQVNVFNGFTFSSLALIYGNEWPESKARVLAQWGEERECPYTVVSMARRNGKTFSTSGVVVSMLLCIPNVKVAIFSTCKRTSMMMMTAVVDMLDKAFEIGTHADRQRYKQVSKNMESLVLEGPDKTKRHLGCFPGSVRVSNVFAVVVGVWANGGRYKMAFIWRTTCPKSRFRLFAPGHSSASLVRQMKRAMRRFASLST